ncbi:Uma2 family endonuclease [Kineosporia babensis]|uniref:Uma2 family endonuclease n=1 Tax=Kineosporia babensis TaxID=499548 RepID=A0A9X1SUP5_9ACTN|nr:Uma2 family endonuclease [Kineosporia babensis]MCD5313119.1 Uma2 family endonuclease [Kineosporia babensis]
MGAEPVYYGRFDDDNGQVMDRYEDIPARWRKPGGFTVDEFFELEDLPPHTELIDGELVFVAAQRMFHMAVLRCVERALLDSVPKHLEVIREMNIVIGTRQAPEPDLSLVPVEAVGDWDTTRFPAEVVVLAVEVESPDSLKRDRIRKVRLYAEGGVQHYWRVERQDDRPVVHVYELDPVARAYVLTGVHHERLKVSVPYDIDIDLTQLARI